MAFIWMSITSNPQAFVDNIEKAKRNFRRTSHPDFQQGLIPAAKEISEFWNLNAAEAYVIAYSYCLTFLEYFLREILWRAHGLWPSPDGGNQEAIEDLGEEAYQLRLNIDQAEQAAPVVPGSWESGDFAANAGVAHRQPDLVAAGRRRKKAAHHHDE
ncbi:hypothetical protein F5Y13DRAFT_203430 [Hypoxylon sp. FL1857]|nr:hypothetical protein F5Y13DRAFT_203430 [Hypoxylon sp. FL1857]